MLVTALTWTDPLAELQWSRLSHKCPLDSNIYGRRGEHLIKRWEMDTIRTAKSRAQAGRVWSDDKLWSHNLYVSIRRHCATRPSEWFHRGSDIMRWFYSDAHRGAFSKTAAFSFSVDADGGESNPANTQGIWERHSQRESASERSTQKLPPTSLFMPRSYILSRRNILTLFQLFLFENIARVPTECVQVDNTMIIMDIGIQWDIEDSYMFIVVWLKLFIILCY